MLSIYVYVPLAINITVQRLDIVGALGVLRWIIALFECISDRILFMLWT